MWRGQAQRLARPVGDGDQPGKGNDERGEDRRSDDAVREKRDDAAIFIGMGRVMVVRGRPAVAVDPGARAGACAKHIEQP